MIRSSIQHQYLANEEFTLCEFQAISIKFEKRALLMFNIYCPPTYGDRARIVMVSEIGRQLAKIKSEHIYDQIILMGDFNCPNIKWEFDNENPGAMINSSSRMTTYETKTIQMAAQHRLEQINCTPNHRGTFLDLCFTTNNSNCKAVRPPLEELLDRECMNHFAVDLQLVFSSQSQRNDEKRVFTFSEKTTRIKRIMELSNFDDVTEEESNHYEIPVILNKIGATLLAWQEIIRKNTVKRCNNLPPDFSSHAWSKDAKYVRLFRIKTTAKKTFLSDQSIQNKQTLKKANEELAAHYNLLKEKYHRKMIANVKGNATEFYKLMRSRNTEKNELPLLMFMGNEQYTGISRIKAIARHLESAFCKDEYFCVDTEEKLDTIYQQFQSNRYEHLWENFSNYFTLNEVCNVIKSLDVKKDPGPMLISAQFVKSNVNIVAPILTNYFNALLKVGHIPEQWKQSYLVPIPKKGKTSDVNNYRGISIQSVIPKIMDQLITRKLAHHVNEIIPEQQHGFIQHKSTSTNLFEKTLFIHEHIARGKQVDVIYFDLSKAFDRINHKLIARRLAEIGTPLAFYKTIMNFVIGREYIVKADGKVTPNAFKTFSAVPQGSHVGPLLFNLATMNIVLIVEGTSIIVLMYADDTKFLNVIQSHEDASQLQIAIDEFTEWAKTNGFTINAAKTFHVSYIKKVANRIDTRYYIEDIPIQKVDEISDLGVVFDSRLSFSTHVERLKTRVVNMTITASRYVNEIHCHALMTKIVDTYIRPIIEYNSVVWRHIRPTLLKKLENVLHRSTRIALNLPYRTDDPRYQNFNNRLNQMNMLTFEERRNIASVVFVIKLLNGELNSKVKSHIDDLRHINVRNTRNPVLFHLSRSTWRNNSPLTMILQQMNDLRGVFSLNDDVRQIKNQLKQHYLRIRNVNMNL